MLFVKTSTQTLPKKKPKRACKFTTDLQKEFPFLHKGSTESDVFCTTCSASFSIAHGGKNDIQRHVSSEKYKKVLDSISKSASIPKYFRSECFGKQETELAKAEGLMAFHTVNHNHSFNSMECTSKVIQKLFEKKIACGKTKTEAIVKNVIAQYSRGI